jgi:xylulokinase
MPDVVLCADLGTQSLRVGAVTPRGGVAAAAFAPLAVVESHPGWSAADPQVWWQALARGVAGTLDRLPARSRVRGVCLCGPTRAQVLLDRVGHPLAPAPLFRDTRAVEEAAAVARHFDSSNPADAITPFHPLARLAWLAQREAALFERVDTVLEPKDFLNFRLTGTCAADSVTYSRFDALRATAPLPAWLQRCVDLLAPKRIDPWRATGEVICREAPFDRLAGLPVFAGAMDTWASAVGAGVVAHGHAYDIGGTSEAAGLIVRERVAISGLVSLRWGETVHHSGGPTQAGADCATWCHETLRIAGRLPGAVERAGGLALDAHRPRFLPYLAGERTPVWRADVRGAFDGVSRAHGPDDFLWAVLEGVAMSVRDILTTAQEGTRERLAEVRVAGGAARSDAWCRIKADVLGVPVVRTTHAETGLIGAAMAASVGLRWHATLVDAARAMCRIERAFEPRASHVAFHAERALDYERAKRHALEDADARVRATASVA